MSARGAGRFDGSGEARLASSARDFAARWRALNAKDSGVARLPAGESRFMQAFRAVEAFDRLAAETYRMRGQAAAGLSGQAADARAREGEEILADAMQDLASFGTSGRRTESSYLSFVREYRRAWRLHAPLFVFVACAFAGSCALGWNIGVHEPDYLSLFVSQEMMEQIVDRSAWFERLQENPLLGAIQIALNNVKVASLTFVAGAAFGFGGLAVLGYNGLVFGATLGLCWANRFHGPLLDFVAAHGPLELTSLAASAFAGLLIGRSFYRPPFSEIPSRMRRTGRTAGVLAMGIVPWLLLAALFEGFVSPFRTFSSELKLLIGLLLALLFWAWTFAEPPPLRQKQRDGPDGS